MSNRALTGKTTYPGKHVLAGDAISPTTTRAVLAMMVDFLKPFLSSLEG
jgi:hypothetical protein